VRVRTRPRSTTIDEPVKRATLPVEGERANRSDTLALTAALVTVVLWASAFVGIRSVSGEFSAGALTLGRLLVGSVILTVVALGRGARLPRRADLPLLLACGLLWFGLYNLALNAAEHRVDAGTAAMIVNINPILVAIMAGVFLHEGFPRRLLLGCAIAFSGAMVIGVATSHTSHSAGLGALLCVLAAFASAAGLVLQKPLLRRMSALEATWLACAIGTVACLPFAPALVREAGDAQASKLAWIVYLGIFPTAIAFTTWSFALARTEAGRLGSTTYLVVPIAILLGWLLLDETPPLIAIGGGALCIFGAALARRR
jgi:drug/metabolite transporter (DMT)-like permease